MADSRKDLPNSLVLGEGELGAKAYDDAQHKGHDEEQSSPN
jgi:hypothetical protein